MDKDSLARSQLKFFFFKGKEGKGENRTGVDKEVERESQYIGKGKKHKMPQSRSEKRTDPFHRDDRESEGTHFWKAYPLAPGKKRRLMPKLDGQQFISDQKRAAQEDGDKKSPRSHENKKKNECVVHLSPEEGPGPKEGLKGGHDARLHRGFFFPV